MSDPVARRYARALYQEAERQGRLDVVEADVQVLRDSLDASPELGRFFRSPVVSGQKKKAVVRSLFEERLGALAYRFVQLLVEKEREDVLAEILQAYRVLLDEQQGVIEVRARAARPLDADNRARLAKAVEDLTGQKARLEVEHDPTLLGGVVLRLGDTVYDGSVRHQLSSLRERLKRQQTTPNGAA